jgi:uncharacterized protein
MISDTESKNILIAGGSGMIGEALSKFLSDNGYNISWLSRTKRENAPYPIYLWNPDQEYVDPAAFDNKPILINLAGESIAKWPWTGGRKKKILNSRLQAIKALRTCMKELDIRLPLILNASAIGIYGHKPGEVLYEKSMPGFEGFLAPTVNHWEFEACTMEKYCDRLTRIRIGLVLSNKGGIWPKLFLTQKFRVFNWFGNGHQIYSWIHMDDLCQAVLFLIQGKDLDKVVNLTAPYPVELKKIIELILSYQPKSCLSFGIPKFLLRIFLGEFSTMLTMDNHVLPESLMRHNFRFKFPDIYSTVDALMKID